VTAEAKASLPGADTLTNELDEHGYALVTDLGHQSAAERLLATLGVLLPQYDGRMTHEVTYRPEHRARSYSQSANTIGPHTEAPGWHPSPARLALYCHRQARCGGGHTDLLDVEVLLAALTAAETELLTTAEVCFPWPHREADSGIVRSTMLRVDREGRPDLRFNYNLLVSNSYDPPLAEHRLPDSDTLMLGEPGRRLADRVRDVFESRRRKVLIPDGAMLIWDNRRMLHGRSRFDDGRRHLTRFFVADVTTD
jgi:hypothetical protein